MFFFGIYVRFLGDLICIGPKYQNSPEKLEYQSMNKNSLPTFSIVSKCFILKGCFRQSSHLVSFVPNPKGPVIDRWSINRLIFFDQEELAKAKAMLKGKMLRQVDEVASVEGFVLCRGVESLRPTIDQLREQLVECWIFLYILAKYLTTVLIHSSQKLFRTA